MGSNWQRCTSWRTKISGFYGQLESQQGLRYIDFWWSVSLTLLILHRECIQCLSHFWVCWLPVTLVLHMTEDTIIHLAKSYFPFRGKRPSFFCNAAASNENKTRPETSAEVFMKCVVCSDISSQWTHTEASCSECRNMPRVLDAVDKWAQSAVFFICTLLPTQREVWYIEKSIVCTTQNSFQEAAYWKIIAE